MYIIIICLYWVCVVCIRVLFVLGLCCIYQGLCYVYQGLVCIGSVLHVSGSCLYWVCVASIRVLFVLGLCCEYQGLACTGSVLRVSGSCSYWVCVACTSVLIWVISYVTPLSQPPTPNHTHTQIVNKGVLT